MIDPGLHNRHAGPDFFNAKVKINGTLWVGNVEIHVRASDWFRHHHDTDPAYKGADSMKLLEVVMEKVRASGYRVGNADVTIVAQRPKMAPYIPQMRSVLAEALGIGENQMSVKATTTEHMGYEGRGEGISAQATALIYENR